MKEGERKAKKVKRPSFELSSRIGAFYRASPLFRLSLIPFELVLEGSRSLLPPLERHMEVEENKTPFIRGLTRIGAIHTRGQPDPFSC